MKHTLTATQTPTARDTNTQQGTSKHHATWEIALFFILIHPYAYFIRGPDSKSHMGLNLMFNRISLKIYYNQIQVKI